MPRPGRSAPGLIIHLIREHHFFEGFGSPYRVDPTELARLLELGPCAQGQVPWPPVNDMLETDPKAADRERTQAEWLASIPSCLADLGPRYLRYDRDMDMGWELEAESLRRLTEAIPNEAERAGVLLRWFSVGNAQWPGQPAHEGIPGNLLLEMRTERIVDFLVNRLPEERHWVGARRLITGWKFAARKRDDLHLLTPIRQGLLDAAQRLGDPVASRRDREQLETLIPPN